MQMLHLCLATTSSCHPILTRIAHISSAACPFQTKRAHVSNLPMSWYRSSVSNLFFANGRVHSVCLRFVRIGTPVHPCHRRGVRGTWLILVALWHQQRVKFPSSSRYALKSGQRAQSFLGRLFVRRVLAWICSLSSSVTTDWGQHHPYLALYSFQLIQAFPFVISSAFSCWLQQQWLHSSLI